MFDMVELESVETRLRAVAAGFDTDALPTAQAAVVVKKAAAIENIAATLKALAAQRAAQAGGHRRRGHRSAAEQLAHDTGTTVGEAIGTLTRGEHLDALPDVAAAALDGRLSPAQAAAIADAAIVNPAAAPKLLDTAASGGSLIELKQECGEAKADVIDREARRKAIHRRRRLRWWTDPEGEAHISANGNPEDIAQFASLIQPLADTEFDNARREGRREHPDAYRYDALIKHCTTANSTPTANGTPADGPEPVATDIPTDAGTGSAPASSGCPEPAGAATDTAAPAGGQATSAPDRDADTDASGPAAGDAPAILDLEFPGATGAVGARAFTGSTLPIVPAPDLAPAPARSRRPSPPAGHNRPKPKRPPTRPRRRTGAPTKLILRVDLDAWLRGTTLPGDICDIVGHGPVAVSAIKDLIKNSDPFVAAVFTKAKRVIGVAHLGRKPTAHQRTVLEWLYPTCAAQGCPATAHLEIDHRIDWADTHITLADWLDALCHPCHLLKTRYGWALVDGVGKRPFVPPDDLRHPKHNHPTGRP